MGITRAQPRNGFLTYNTGRNPQQKPDEAAAAFDAWQDARESRLRGAEDGRTSGVVRDGEFTHPGGL